MSSRREKTIHVRNAMIARCHNPDNKGFINYGARGIKVCERWLDSHENFIADMGLKPDGYSIERINNDGDYTLENCKWIPISKQSKNRRSCRMYNTIHGKLCLKDVWRLYAHKSVSYRRAVTRISRDGWGIVRALREPTSLGKNKFGNNGDSKRRTA